MKAERWRKEAGAIQEEEETVWEICGWHRKGESEGGGNCTYMGKEFTFLLMLSRCVRGRMCVDYRRGMK